MCQIINLDFRLIEGQTITAWGVEKGNLVNTLLRGTIGTSRSVERKCVDVDSWICSTLGYVERTTWFHGLLDGRLSKDRGENPGLMFQDNPTYTCVEFVNIAMSFK